MRHAIMFAFALLISLGTQVHAHKFPQHLQEFRSVLPGLEGEPLREVYRNISQGIDTEFGELVSQHFQQPIHFNHRVIGHWGFQGDIPFNVEPWRSELAKYPRRELIKLWQDYATRLVADTAEKTGLPLQQAKGLTGLIYNLHLLGDREAGQVMVDSVVPTTAILRDIEKNLHSLFGKHSAVAREVAQALHGIPRSLPDTARASRALEILREANLDEKLMTQYGAMLRKNQIHFTPARTTGATREGVRRARSFLQKPTTLTPRESLKAMRKLTDQKNVTTAPGLLTKDGTLLVLTPSRVVRATKMGLTYGLVGLASDSAVAAWYFLRGETWAEEFREELCNAVIRNVFVGTCVAVTVVLGASPHGWCVFGVAIGAYFIAETAIHFWNVYQDRQYLTIDDLRGFGVYADTPLDNRDTILMIPTDTNLQLPRESVLAP